MTTHPAKWAKTGYAMQFWWRTGLFLCLFAGFFAQVEAGHFAGADLSYECVNNCTIRVTFKGYRVCASTIPTVSPIPSVTIVPDSGCVAPTPLLQWQVVSNVEVTPVCPTTVTECDSAGAGIPGIMEHTWERDYDFCSANCSTYTIKFSLCCRNSAITTIALPNATAAYISTTINPLLNPCNNSPVFNNAPVPFICQNQPYIFNQGASDPDGDSLAYSLGPCLSDSAQNVNYLSFASFTQPLTNDWIVQVDSLTGDITIVPNPNVSTGGSIQVGVMCLYVEEWRNGVLINTIVRDMMLTVIPCPPNVHPTTNGVSNVVGGFGSGTNLSTCVGATLCADIRVLDQDPGQTQMIWWDQSLAPLGATFTAAGIPSITDTVIGVNPSARFCWSPTAPGTYSFVVSVRDDFCPTFGQNQYTYTVEVGQLQVVAHDSIAGCGPVELCADPLNGTYPFAYQWAGSGGITPADTDSCFIHPFPGPGVYPYTLSITDSIGCTASYSDTVFISNNVLADAGEDTTTCANQPTVIGMPAQANPDLTYLWFPATGLNNPTLAQPTVTLPNNTQGPIFQTYILQLTDTVTSCTDFDTMTVTVFPIPESPFIMPNSACQGEVIAATYTGNAPGSATFDWTFSLGSPPIANGIGPQQVAWIAPGLHEVTLTVTANGCPSPVQRDTINIIPNPIALIGPVADQCHVGNSFNFTNNSIYGPNPTFTWTFWPNATPSVSNSAAPTGVTFASPGIKVATLEITENGCTSNIDSVFFTVHADPDPNWTWQGGAQCFAGNSFNFQTTGNNGAGAVYAWSFQHGNPSTSSINNPTVTFLSPGPKTVSLTVQANGCTSTRIDTVWVFPEPTVDAGLPGSFCEGESGAQLSGSVTGGTAPYYWTWSCDTNVTTCGIDSMFDDDPLVLPGDSVWYYVQVTDVNGCKSDSDSVFVSVIPKPIVDAGPDVAICDDGGPCVVLTPTISGGSGSYNYLWIPGTGLNDSTIRFPCARPDTTTIYALVVTDLATGCSSEYNTLDTLSTVTVTVNARPIADAGPDHHACPDDTVQLVGSGTGAGPGYNYQWSPGSGLSDSLVHNPLAYPTQTTDYTLVVYSNGCPSLADTARVIVHTTPSVDAGWDREICLGESVLLDGTAGGDSTASFSFNWTSPIGLNDPSAEDPIATPDTTTTYYVMATSNWGCASTLDSVTVYLRPTPLAEAGLPAQVCEGDSLRLDGSYYYGKTDSVPNASQIYYGWTPAINMNDSTLPSPAILPTMSGWYYLQVQHNVCTTLDSVFITVIPELNAQAIADTNVICRGDSVLLTALGGIGSPNYIWSPATGLSDPGAQAPMAAPDSTTTYQLILQEAGCADTSGVTVEVIPSPTASYVHSGLSGCPPLEVSFTETSSDGIFHIWDLGDGSPITNAHNVVHTYTDPGTYTVTLTVVNTFGCDDAVSTAQVQVEAPVLPAFSSNPPAPVELYLPSTEVQFFDNSDNAVQWTWDFGDGTQSGETNPTHHWSEPGTYMVQLRIQNDEGCIAEVTGGPYIVVNGSVTLYNVFSPNGDGINDNFAMEYIGNEPFLMVIYDRWGKKMFETRDRQKGWKGKDLKGKDAPEGVYYYVVTIGKKEYTGTVTLVR